MFCGMINHRRTRCGIYFWSLRGFNTRFQLLKGHGPFHNLGGTQQSLQASLSLCLRWHEISLQTDPSSTPYASRRVGSIRPLHPSLFLLSIPQKPRKWALLRIFYILPPFKKNGFWREKGTKIRIFSRILPHFSRFWPKKGGKKRILDFDSWKKCPKTRKIFLKIAPFGRKSWKIFRKSGTSLQKSRPPIVKCQRICQNRFWQIDKFPVRPKLTNPKGC